MPTFKVEVTREDIDAAVEDYRVTNGGEELPDWVWSRRCPIARALGRIGVAADVDDDYHFHLIGVDGRPMVRLPTEASDLIRAVDHLTDARDWSRKDDLAPVAFEVEIPEGDDMAVDEEEEERG